MLMLHVLVNHLKTAAAKYSINPEGPKVENQHVIKTQHALIAGCFASVCHLQSHPTRKSF